MELEDAAKPNDPRQPPVNGEGSTHAPYSGAFPRNILRIRQEVANNVKQAMIELETEDPNIDPRDLSKHVGPSVRKSQPAEEGKAAEDAREAKRNKKTRGRTTTAGKNALGTR